ncbi:hypothetical protein Y032_0157g3190 [Ancylostoma ceylanicum]|nr:hypothetical protein Y032_0157g3190 [Ancylostoma ceylanicum]
MEHLISMLRHLSERRRLSVISMSNCNEYKQKREHLRDISSPTLPPYHPSGPPPPQRRPRKSALNSR